MPSLTKFNFEKRTQMWLGIVGIALAVILLLTSLGQADVARWTASIAAFAVGIVLLSEGAFLSYLNKSGYKSISFGDVIVWFSFGVGLLLIFQGLLVFNVIGETAPAWLSNIISTNGVIVSSLAVLLFLYHAFMPRAS